MIVIILKFKNLNRSIVFSICFIYIFNLSSVVYANHKVKGERDERIVGVGTLVSTGLAFLAKAEVIAVLSAVALRLGMDMNNTTQSAVQEFYENYQDVVQSAKNFGKSENGLIAVSKNAIDKFTTFLKEKYDSMVNKNEFGPWTELRFNMNLNESVFCKPYEGLVIGKGVEFEIKGLKNFDGVYSSSTNFKILPHVFSYPTINLYYRDDEYMGFTYPSSVVKFRVKGGFGTYIPDNTLTDDENNVYTGNGDFILNPTWDVSANTGSLAGFPSLPWDKSFEATGNIGVLNPDGTITDSPSVPDVENPDVPDVDTNEQTGILGWLSKFWENLWNFCMELVKKLFYPQKAIDAWTNLNSMIWDKFRFLGQLNGIKWTTNNNQRLRIPFNYNNRTYIIQLPDSFEENNVTYFRNIFKYFVYAITLFVCVRILRPRFTIGTR